jgi:DNA (cytosine-5)-methyltransferase 1
MTLTAVELFAGIGGFRLALDSAGIETIWANDIDSTAATVYRAVFGPTRFAEGDIRALGPEVPAHDILTAGFPCQPFSSAGKKLGIRDPRGTLFQEIVNVLLRCKPGFFILENVKRLLTMESGVHFATVLAALSECGYVVEWRLLNACDVGLPQSRERIFITGRKVQSELPTAVALATREELKAAELACGWPDDWNDIAKHGTRFPSWGIAIDGRFVGADLGAVADRATRRILAEVLEPEVSESYDYTDDTKSRILKSVPVGRQIGGIEILYNQGGGARMGYTVFGVNGLAPTLTAATSRHYERYRINDRYRRLTEIEYARIQGFPDAHCAAVRPYQQYGLLGNAVPPVMVAWVLKRLLSEERTTLTNTKTQTSLFSQVA